MREEATLRNYLESLHDLGYLASTLWSFFSILKSFLERKYNLDVIPGRSIVTMLKLWQKDEEKDQVQVFTFDNIINFIVNAPDRDYLHMKAVLLIGYSGLLRVSEMTSMLVNDVTQIDSGYECKVVRRKQVVNRREWKFNVVEPNFVQIIQKFLQSRNAVIGKTTRLFVKYHDGKCFGSPLGKNTFCDIAKSIARFLNLNPELYGGHSFRRTGATLLAEFGGTMTELKQSGGWRSTSVAEQYINESIRSRVTIASKLGGNCNSNATENSLTSSSETNQGVTFHLGNNQGTVNITIQNYKP